MSADAAEAVAASTTMALRAVLAPPRHCPACGAEVPAAVAAQRTSQHW